MTQVSQNNFHGIPAVRIALDKLKVLKASRDVLPAGLTNDDIEALIEHCESTMGNFQLPDVPM